MKRNQKPKRVDSSELGDDFEPNRWQRRDYNRFNNTRQVRKNIVGFGRWRRPRDTSYPSYALMNAPPQVEPRWARRKAMIADAKAHRRERLRLERLQRSEG